MNKVSYFRKQVMERYENNDLPDAIQAGESLLQEHESNQSCQGMAYADDLFNLARIYDEIGYFERASELYVESARLAFTETGESPYFARRLNNLAAMLTQMGRGDAAFHLFAHTADVMRQTLEPNSPELADAIYNLANSAADQGRQGKALKLHNEALAIREAAGQTEDTVHSLHSIAVIYEGKKDLARAIRYAERAMKLAKGTAAHTGACYYLAELYEEDGKHRESAALFADILRHIVKTAGRNHSAYVTVATRLALTLMAQEEHRRALSLQRSIGEILKRKTGENHLFYANCLRSMAILHKRLHETGEAERLMLQSIRIRLRVMGENARDILTDALFMIDLYLTDHQMEKALEMLVFVLMRAGDGHPGYKKTLDELTKLYVRADGISFQTISEEIEKLNDRGRLSKIIQYWTDWETPEG